MPLLAPAYRFKITAGVTIRRGNRGYFGRLDVAARSLIFVAGSRNYEISSTTLTLVSG